MINNSICHAFGVFTLQMTKNPLLFSKQTKKCFTIIDFLFSYSCCCCEWLRREQNLKSVLNVVTFINCVTFAWLLDSSPSISALYFFPHFFPTVLACLCFFWVLFIQCMGFIPFKLSFVCYFHAKSDLRFCLWLQALFCFSSLFFVSFSCVCPPIWHVAVENVAPKMATKLSKYVQCTEQTHSHTHAHMEW